jgi:hypothetical protein
VAHNTHAKKTILGRMWNASTNSPPRPGVRHRLLRCEPLEDRRLLSAASENQQITPLSVASPEQSGAVASASAATAPVASGSASPGVVAANNTNVGGGALSPAANPLPSSSVIITLAVTSTSTMYGSDAFYFTATTNDTSIWEGPPITLIVDGLFYEYPEGAGD